MTGGDHCKNLLLPRSRCQSTRKVSTYLTDYTVSQILSPHSEVVICLSAYIEFAEISRLDGGDKGRRLYRITHLCLLFYSFQSFLTYPHSLQRGYHRRRSWEQNGQKTGQECSGGHWMKKFGSWIWSMGPLPTTSVVSPAVGTASSYKYPSRHTWTISEQVIETYSVFGIDCQMPSSTRWLLIAQ